MKQSSFDHTFSYAPLFENLNKLGMDIEDLKRRCHLGDSTVIKLLTGQPVYISVLCKIAIMIGLGLDDVVDIDYNWNYEDSLEFKRNNKN